MLRDMVATLACITMVYCHGHKLATDSGGVVDICTGRHQALQQKKRSSVDPFPLDASHGTEQEASHVLDAVLPSLTLVRSGRRISSWHVVKGSPCIIITSADHPLNSIAGGREGSSAGQITRQYHSG